MIPPELLGRAVGEDSTVAHMRSETAASIAIRVPFTSGAVGSAHIELFIARDAEDRGGFVVRLTVEDGGGSFAPFGKNLPNGVELHLTGEAEGAAFLSALSGLLMAMNAPSGLKIGSA